VKGRAAVRGATGILVALALWELATALDGWTGVGVPFLAHLPEPTEVVGAFGDLLTSHGYWNSWKLSFERVAWGFGFGLVLGVPLGLLLATSRTVKRVLFPVFETVRPIPPLAWVPLSILFWPTSEESITFVIFLGGFFPIVLNTFAGAERVDRRLLLGARSLGASRLTIFRRVVLPAALPSIVTGAAVGMGITWEVVVAAELISGGGSSSGDGGLGFLVWSAYQGGDIPRVVAGMISLGIAGYLASGAVRLLGARLMPWERAG
jgi:NitT/TauT family transport system permease protein